MTINLEKKAIEFDFLEYSWCTIIWTDNWDELYMVVIVRYLKGEEKKEMKL